MGAARVHNSGNRMHRMQSGDGREFDQVDRAGARAPREVPEEPEASVGASRQRFEQGAESRARHNGARARSRVWLGEEAGGNWWRWEASGKRRVTKMATPGNKMTGSGS